MSVPFFVMGIILGVLDLHEHWIGRTLMAAISVFVLMPFIFIVMILLYYDLRVRKESYDIAALTEALRR
jgi:hypothetical protein